MSERKRQLTRRSFLKAVAAAGIASSAATTIGASPALAESQPTTSPSPEVKRVRSACRGCGKCECGVWVTVQNGRIVRIEGDESAPQTNGNCCTKSQASMQAAYHPDRLTYPMKRSNPKGEDPGWVRISWDEAGELVSRGLKEIQEKYGPNSIMIMTGTSRVWGSCGNGFGNVLGTLNRYSAGQICKGPRNLSGTLTDMFGSYWLENVDILPNRVYVQWGTECAYSNYDDSCRTMVEVSQRAAKRILIDPRITPIGKEADIWLPVRPGTDGAIAMAWTRLVIDRELYDNLFVRRWTNAPYLVCKEIEPTGAFILEGETAFNYETRLLKESDLVEGGSPYRFMVWDEIKNGLTWYDTEICEWEDEPYERVKPTTGREIYNGWLPDPSQFDPMKSPALYGEFDITLKDGRTVKAKPVWEYYAERVDKYTPEYAAEITGCSAEAIEEAGLAWATRTDPTMPNGGIHFQLATDQCGNAIQTIRCLNLLCDICGCFDSPAGGRGPTAGNASATPIMVNPKGPSKKPTVPNWEKRKTMVGVDKFPLTRYFSNWTDANSLWNAAQTGEPYPVVGCMSCTGNFMSQSNSIKAWEALKGMQFMVVEDLWHVPQSDLADVLFPSAHWLETSFPRLSQGPSGGQGATIACATPPGEAKTEAEFQIWFAKIMGVPWNKREGANPWPDLDEYMNYLVENVRGYPEEGRKKPYTWEEYAEKFEKDGWWLVKKLTPERWGTFHRYEMGQLHTPAGFGIKPLTDKLPGMFTVTRKVEIWSTIMEYAMGDQWERFTLPDYDEPYKTPVSAPELFEEYPFIMTTGSRNPTFFHSEHRQLPWCRELWPAPRVELHPDDARSLGVEQGDWVWIENENGKIRQVVDIYHGLKRGVVNANHTWWYPETKKCGKGWDLSAINVLVYADDQDPTSGISTLRSFPVKIYKATPENSPFGNPCPCDDDGTPVICDATDARLKEWMPVYEGRE